MVDGSAANSFRGGDGEDSGPAATICVRRRADPRRAISAIQACCLPTSGATAGVAPVGDGQPGSVTPDRV